MSRKSNAKMKKKKELTCYKEEEEGPQLIMAKVQSNE